MSGKVGRIVGMLLLTMLVLGSVVLASSETPPLNDDAGTYLLPTAALAPDGSIWAAWVANLGDDWEILASRWNDGTWAPAEIVFANPDRWDDAPSLAFDANGVAWLAWTSSDGADGTLHLSHWTGYNWSVPQNVPAGDTGPNRQPVLAATPDGGLWLAWVGFDGNDDEIYAAHWDGSTWSEPQRISSDDADPSAYDRAPALAVGADGSAWLAWTSHGQYIDNEIFAAQWDGQRWTGEQQVNQDDDSVDSAPSLAITEDGTVWLGWHGSTFEPEESRLRVFVNRWTEAAGWGNETMVSSPPESAVYEDRAVVTLGADGWPQVLWHLDDGGLGLGYATFDGSNWSSPQWAVQEAVVEGSLIADDASPLLAWWTKDASRTLPFKASNLNLGTTATELPIFESPGYQIQGTQYVENRHLAFGDSITLGAYPDPATGVSVGPYPERLEVMLDSQVIESEVINDGVSGERTTAGRWRLLEGSWGLYEPQYLELMEGTNDITGDKDPSDIIYRLEEMVRWPKKLGTHVMIATLLPRTDHRNGATKELNILIRQMADKRNVVLADVWDAYYATGHWAQYLADTVHPDTEGMVLLTETFYNALMNSAPWLSEDGVPPQTWIEPLPAQSPCGDVLVRWNGSDDRSYVVDYDVQMQVNSGTWTDWIMATPDTSSVYSSQVFGSTVAFRVRGRDASGNQNSYSSAVSTQITDDSPPEVHLNALPAAQKAPFQVSWSGTDACGQVERFDVETRVGPAGEWQDWLESTSSTSSAFAPDSPQYGETYYFHVGAYDQTGNWSGWSSETSTILARYMLEGQAYNTRHQPVLEAKVSAPDALSVGYDSSRYTAYLLDEGNYTLEMSHDSYGEMPPMRAISVTADLAGLDFFLPPLDELVSDGGFEDGDWGDWQTTGTLTPTLDAKPHTGYGAVLMGGEGETSQISQTLSIPDGLNNTTLSFLARLDDKADGSSTIQVELEGTAIKSTQTISSDEWTHIWLPVDEVSAGQKVTLTFAMTDTAAVRLDEVSLGSAVQRGFWTNLPLILRTPAP